MTIASSLGVPVLRQDGSEVQAVPVLASWIRFGGTFVSAYMASQLSIQALILAGECAVPSIGQTPRELNGRLTLRTMPSTATRSLVPTAANKSQRRVHQLHQTLWLQVHQLRQTLRLQVHQLCQTLWLQIHQLRQTLWLQVHQLCQTLRLQDDHGEEEVKKLQLSFVSCYPAMVSAGSVLA